MASTNDDLDLLARVERLEQRLRTVEDELEITRTVVEYGLAVDSGEAEVTGQLFAEDAVFDVDGDNVMRGRAAVEAMVLGRGHQTLLPNCAHTIGPVVVETDGDSARATGYSRIYRRDRRLLRAVPDRVQPMGAGTFRPRLADQEAHVAGARVARFTGGPAVRTPPPVTDLSVGPRPARTRGFRATRSRLRGSTWRAGSPTTSHAVRTSTPGHGAGSAPMCCAT